MHKNTSSKVVLITGALSGVGRFVAERLMKEGYRVYGTSRKLESGREDAYSWTASKGKGSFRLVPMDINVPESVRKAVAHVMDREGRIDILINNAGIVTAGSVEDTTTEEASRQFETNFFGTHRMCREVLPIMRAQKQGQIITISSMAAILPLPFQSMYCASKSALESMTEAMRMEVRPYGIRVSLIEPGDMATGNTAGRIFAAASADSIYSLRFTRAMAVVAKDEQGGPEPTSVAGVVSRLAKRRNPPVRVATAGFQYKLFKLLCRILPDRFILWIIERMY